MGLYIAKIIERLVDEENPERLEIEPKEADEYRKLIQICLNKDRRINEENEIIKNKEIKQGGEKAKETTQKLCLLQKPRRKNKKIPKNRTNNYRIRKGREK